jgi:hypothetical protein
MTSCGAGRPAAGPTGDPSGTRLDRWPGVETRRRPEVSGGTLLRNGSSVITQNRQMITLGDQARAWSQDRVDLHDPAGRLDEGPPPVLEARVALDLEDV